MTSHTSGPEDDSVACAGEAGNGDGELAVDPNVAEESFDRGDLRGQDGAVRREISRYTWEITQQVRVSHGDEGDRLLCRDQFLYQFGEEAAQRRGAAAWRHGSECRDHELARG